MYSGSHFNAHNVALCGQSHQQKDALCIFIITVESLQFAQKPPTLHIYAFFSSLLWVKAAVKGSL